MTTTPEQALELFAPACALTYANRSGDCHAPLTFGVIGEISDGEKLWGFVAHDTVTRATLIAFRGTDPHSAEEWLQDFTAIPVNIPWAPNVGLVHEGFLDVYDGIRDSLKLAMPKYEAAGRVYLTGHSLGAALATLAAYDFRQWEPVVVTFAGPRVGTHAFARNWNQTVRQGCIRYVNVGDIVPDVPLEPVFCHVGTEVEIDGGFDPINPAVAHSITGAYMSGLKKLASK